MRFFLVFLIMIFNCHITVKGQTINSKKMVYSYSGKINSTIPIFLWFEVKDSVIIGQVTYLKSKQPTPIRIIGIINEDGIKLNEFLNDGTVTGIFFGKIVSNNFLGNWFSPKTRKELTFDLKKKDTILMKIDTAFDANDFSGNYRYNFGKSGAQGSMKVSKINKSLFSIDFFNTTDLPARNVAEIKLDKLQISNNEVVYKLEDGGSCVFRIKFFKNFAIVQYVNNQDDCGFGNNADIDGVYLRNMKSY